MQEDKLQKILLKLGSTPQQSLRYFLSGLALFVVGVACIYIGPSLHIWLQVIGLFLLACALILAARGYLGILANRLAFFRHNAAKNRQKYRHIK